MLNVQLVFQDLSWKILLVSTSSWNVADILQLIHIGRQKSLFEMKEFPGRCRVKFLRASRETYI